MTTELFEDYEAITFSREGRILTMTLNRPDTLNAASVSHPIGLGTEVGLTNQLHHLQIPNGAMFERVGFLPPALGW
jgi:hypothetical protein